MSKEAYNNLVDKLSGLVIKALLSEPADPMYSIWLDQEYSRHILTQEVDKYLANNFCQSEHSEFHCSFTLDTIQLIAGHSSSIEDSFNGQYVRDTLSDVALGALQNDVVNKIKSLYSYWDAPSPCERS